MLGTASLVEILTVTFRSPSLPAGSRKMSQPVITIDAALSALASANTPDELITLANQAAALQLYARRAKLGMVAQNRCAEIRLRAERKLGELLTMTPRLHGRPKVFLERTLCRACLISVFATANCPTAHSGYRRSLGEILIPGCGGRAITNSKLRRASCSRFANSGRQPPEIESALSAVELAISWSLLGATKWAAS